MSASDVASCIPLADATGDFDSRCDLADWSRNMETQGQGRAGKVAMNVAELRQEIKDEKRKQIIDADTIECLLPPTDDKNCLFKDSKIQLWYSTAQNLYFIPNDSIDLIITSPPYNIGKKTGNGRILWRGVSYGNDQDAIPEDEYQELQLLALAEMWRVAKPGASLFYNHKVRNRRGVGIHPLEWLFKTEWIFRQEIIWDRGSTHNHGMTYFWPVTELIFWLTKGIQDIYISPEGAEMTTIWRFNFKTNTAHPAPFPQELPARCIRAASKRGDIVLDPFGGSMTTCFMANQLGRLSIGVDRNKEYITKAALRCSQKILL